MRLSVDIDPDSGFCGGVIRAINEAERFLSDNPGKELLSLGAMVHNEAEIARLSARGLVTIDKDSMMPGATLLIRAHGEPPQTYARAEALGMQVVDCTCPVVLKLQKDIKETYSSIKPRGGQIIIFGKVGHAEVLGLLGQVGGDAAVLENIDMLQRVLLDGTVRKDVETHIFSQTTKDPQEYEQVCKCLADQMSHRDLLTVHSTICRQVASRRSKLASFCASHDVVIFVAGSQSSNGSVLYKLCLANNLRSHLVSSASEIDSSWFRDGDSVGVSGATSTPKWLLEEVSSAISGIL